VRDATNAIKGPLSLFFLGAGGGESCSSSSNDPTVQCEPMPPADVDPLTEISNQIGIAIPDDLVSLLGSDAVVAYGGIAGDGTPKIGLRAKPADLTAAENVVTKLRNKLVDSDVELGEKTAGSDFVVATTNDYAADLAKPGTLGTVGKFADAMRDMPSSVEFATYVDLGNLLPLATHGAVPQLDHLTAMGWWSANVDGMTKTQIRLIVH
jgi:hypothetical protein